MKTSGVAHFWSGGSLQGDEMVRDFLLEFCLIYVRRMNVRKTGEYDDVTQWIMLIYAKDTTFAGHIDLTDA